MGLLDEIRAEKTAGKPCKVARHMSEMSKEDAKDLQTALADTKIPTAHIENVLVRNGYPVGHSALHKHRTGTCCCAVR